MQRNEISRDDGRTYCLRHPNTETGLRCGRCDTLICPRCMVSTPVGARCPDCARIGRPKALDTSATEWGRAVLSGLLAALVCALVLASVFWVTDRFLPPIFNLFIGVAGMAGMGYIAGEAVRIGSGNKIETRLKYVAATVTFAGWAASIILLSVFAGGGAVLGSFYGIIGMIVGVYIAMYRVRAPGQ